MADACSTRDCTGATTLSETVEHWFIEKKCLGPERSLTRQELGYSFSCGETTKALPKCIWTLTGQSRCSGRESTWYALAPVPKRCGESLPANHGTTLISYYWTTPAKNGSSDECFPNSTSNVYF